MSLLTAQIHPGQALGFLVLGATLHDLLTRLKAEPQRFPHLDLIYDQASPVREPVVLNLPSNGIRLRFDGPEQRLRLIEVLDFTKNHLTYKDKDVLRPPTTSQATSASTENLSGPTFKHIYNRLLGPTFPGEFVPPEADDETGEGMYVLSYPGIAFSFQLHISAWSPKKDFVAALSSATGKSAASMAIFRGDSWPEAREQLYTQTLNPQETFAVLMKSREPVADEVRLVKIYGKGHLELVRSEGNSPFIVELGHTLPQDLVANLGPPDAIYRKSDQRMSIHKARQGSRSRDPSRTRLQDDSTDTDQSSAHTATDEEDEGEEDAEAVGKVSKECFYNYFYHGFDILLSSPVPASQCPPSQLASTLNDRTGNIAPTNTSKRLVATKIILHGNVPGSYSFNRHRRCQWEIQYLKTKRKKQPVNSETLFKDIEQRLQDEWKSIYKNSEDAKARQRGMVLNRDWGDSPGSSVELLGGWEDSVGGKRINPSGADDGNGLGNTTLYGFPGLVFEVLQNGTVSGLTVF